MTRSWRSDGRKGKRLHGWKSKNQVTEPWACEAILYDDENNVDWLHFNTLSVRSLGNVGWGLTTRILVAALIMFGLSR